MSSPESPTREELLARLAQAGRAMSDAAVMFHAVVAARMGLGSTDWKTLSLLEQRGAVTAGALADATGLAPASVTGILDRLERGGWILRERDPADRRRVIVTLSPESGKEAAPLFAGLTSRLDDLYATYTERELALLVDFMVEVAHRQREATAELEGDGGFDADRE